MKNLYFNFILLFLATTAFAQNYHPLIKPNKYWDVMYHDNSICGYASGARYFFDGSDTIINNQTYQIIKAHPIISLSSPFCPPFYVDTSITFTNGSVFMREDIISEKVYVFFNADGNEYLLYDFNLLSGDTLSSFYASMGGQNLVIDSVGTVTLFDASVKKVIFLNNGEYYIEGIGSTRGLFNPMVVGIGFEYSAQCVMENGVNLYWGNCYSIVGINDLTLKERINIYPNPGTDIFNFTFSSLSISALEIYNVNGKLIYKEEMKNLQEALQLDLSGETPGIYFCKIISGEQYYTTKIIKQ
jgi:hypothetical protein